MSNRPILSWTRPSVVWILVTACGVTGCDRKEEKQETSVLAPSDESAPTAAADDKPSAKEARKLASVLPPPEKVQPVVNPKGLEPYDGPTGGVRGVVRAGGDTPPALPEVVAKIERNCTTSRQTFGVLFREGEGRALADVLVAVTGYEGYVPIEGTEVVVEGEGCAWDRRTVAMTFGQRLRINGKDNRPYVPELLEQPMPAQLFVLPTAPTVDISPQRPGRFKLVDSMRLYNIAEVFVLPYPTADVTDESGRFEIKGIPVGPVKVNAFLPQTGAVVEKAVEIEPGQVLDLEFELSFDRSSWDERPKPTPLDELPTRDELAQ